MFPHMTVTGEACPMWVPLVENNEFDSPGADYFVRKHLERSREPDRLSTPSSRNGYPFDKAGKLSFPDHRVRCQILRCRLCFLESSGRGGTDSIG